MQTHQEAPPRPLETFSFAALTTPRRFACKPQERYRENVHRNNTTEYTLHSELHLLFVGRVHAYSESCIATTPSLGKYWLTLVAYKYAQNKIMLCGMCFLDVYYLLL
jgi:hypothetical protein